MEKKIKQLTKQNLRELAKLTLLNLMSANGVMAKTIIRNYKQKQERENVCFRLQKKINLQNEFKKIR
tara:strand:- start:106 stop:306 length:201 start_codon:yes stop_codon:yes gene_type:complete